MFDVQLDHLDVPIYARCPVQLPEFLQTMSDGEIRLKGHRIRLIDVAQRYDEGYSAETIALDYYPTLELGLVYKTIGFYLENEIEVRENVAANRAEIERQASKPQTTPTLAELRRRMSEKQREAS